MCASVSEEKGPDVSNPIADGADVENQAKEGATEAPASDMRRVGKSMSMSMTMRVGGGGGNHTLEVEDLSYAVAVKDGQDTTTKTLIHPTSFKIKPREMLAIMGASGAGKSTMLDTLACRIPPSQVEGSYTIDGEKVAANFKRIAGYVMQDDALYPMLTVRETLQYAALLRIPDLEKEEKLKLVEETISSLRLEKAADTVIGDERVRGISGGERRRVSIGVDTIQQPAVIFLDEPTSGLDSTTALTIVETLKDMCQRDRTVAMTIHQPSTRVFDTFDKVMFLSRGRLVYNGAPGDLPEFCASLGKPPAAYSNIAEHYLEVVDTYEASDTVDDLAKSSRQRTRQISSVAGLDASTPIEDGDEYACSPLQEMGILLHRNYRNLFRTPDLSIARMGLSIMMGLIMGSVYWNTTVDDEGIAQRAGYFSFAIALYLFTALEALPIFLQERNIYLREQSRGAYRAGSYVVANGITPLPFFLAMAVVFSAITYWMIDLPTSGFGLQVFILFMVITAGNSFATFVSGLAPDPITGNSMGTALLAIMFLFSGFFIRRESIPVGWRWFSTLSLFRYPFEGFMLNMIDEDDEITGDRKEFLRDEYDVSGNKWEAVWVLALFSIGFRFIFFLTLKFLYTGDRK